MSRLDDGLYAAMLQRGMSRRSFLKFSIAIAGALALPATYAPRIAAAVATAPRIPVIWLRGQACAGNTAAFLRATDPTISELLLDLLSVEYDETLMAPSGADAELSRITTMEKYPNGYIAIVEGGIPTADDGVYCMVGGRAFKDVVREVCDGALATIAVGSCAFDGGAPAAAGGPTGAVGVAQVVPGGQLVNLPGCPLNVENLTATIVHYLTFKQWPATDGRGRPLFAYGGLIHNQCERRAHFEFGEFVAAWGDEGVAEGLVPLQDGLQGAGDVRQLPDRPVRRRDELAGEGRPWLHRLHDAALLGRDEPVLPAAAGAAAVRPDGDRRPGGPGARGRRRRRDRGARCGQCRPGALRRPREAGAPLAPAAVEAPEAATPGGPAEAEADVVDALAPAAVEAPEAATPGGPAEAEADVVDALAPAAVEAPKPRRRPRRGRRTCDALAPAPSRRPKPRRRVARPRPRRTGDALGSHARRPAPPSGKVG